MYIGRRIRILVAVLVSVILMLSVSGCTDINNTSTTAPETTDVATVEETTAAETKAAAPTAEEITTEEAVAAETTDAEVLAEASVVYPLAPKHEDLLGRANIIALCDSNSFLDSFEYGDKVRVEFDTGEVLQIPVCGNYDDVEAGASLLRVKPDKDKITIATNYGALARELGFVDEAPEGSDDPFIVNETKFPKEVKITLMEKGAYLDSIALSNLQYSPVREEYPNLTDEEFANFGMVDCGDIAPYRLYRSSSPIDDSISRNKYVDQAMRNHKIKDVINMTDDEKSAKKMPGYNDSYYSTCNVLFEDMSLSFGTDSFDKGIADCIRFISDNEGPYLVHCLYGKDRTGLLCAILESLCGAEVEEIQKDYAKSYDRLYNIEGKQKVTEKQKGQIEGNILRNMSYAYKSEMTKDNHTEKTKEYLKSIGITDDEIERVIENLTSAK